jgi:hypothetical protein
MSIYRSEIETRALATADAPPYTPGGEPLFSGCSSVGTQQAAPGNYPACELCPVPWERSASLGRAHEGQRPWRTVDSLREPPAAYLQNCNPTKRLPSRRWVARAFVGETPGNERSR